MPLQRFSETVLWDNYSASANEETDAVDVEKASQLGIYVYTDTDINLDVLVYVNGAYKILTTESIPALTDYFITWMVYPWGYTKFRVDTACTITLVAFRKT